MVWNCSSSAKQESFDLVTKWNELKRGKDMASAAIF